MKFVAIGPNAWGKANTLHEAIENCRQNCSYAIRKRSLKEPAFIVHVTNDDKCGISEMDGSIRYNLEIKEGDKIKTGYCEVIGAFNRLGKILPDPKGLRE